MIKYDCDERIRVIEELSQRIHNGESGYKEPMNANSGANSIPAITVLRARHCLELRWYRD